MNDILNGLQFQFKFEPGLIADLTHLIEQEQVCCSFLRFRLDIEPGPGPITLEVTGPAGTGEMLRKL
ncbi:MAG: hypothetical protein HY286_17480 [Planctomycetes bacterium]|nr:hypothetical protein [Planctomycetota bacterium]